MSDQTETIGYRVVAVAFRGEEVLLHRTEMDDFWSLPGGRCEFGETAAEALRREMVEEVGVEVIVGRLLWVVENFFVYQEQRWHGLGLYFSISLSEGSPLLQAEGPVEGNEEGLKATFRWIRLANLWELDLRPAFLKSALPSPPETVQHIISRQ